MELGSFSIVAVKDAFYIFDGVHTKVYRFSVKKNNWDDFGNLKSRRRAHKVIYDGSMFYVVGGEEDPGDGRRMSTEKCEFFHLPKDRILCDFHSPHLEGFLYPALFVVNSNTN